MRFAVSGRIVRWCLLGAALVVSGACGRDRDVASRRSDSLKTRDTVAQRPTSTAPALPAVGETQLARREAPVATRVEEPSSTPNVDSVPADSATVEPVAVDSGSAYGIMARDTVSAPEPQPIVEPNPGESLIPTDTVSPDSIVAADTVGAIPFSVPDSADGEIAPPELAPADTARDSTDTTTVAPSTIPPGLPGNAAPSGAGPT